jgi:hypothetical protein
MTSLLWILIAIQIAMGVFDTFYHHELTERLAWRPSQRYELQLHALRNMLYALLFLVLGWLEVHGILAMLIIAVLASEIVITLMDFVEEDMSRKLPASERINHTLLAINYGAILVLLLPVLLGWAAQPTGVKSAYTGWLSLVAAASAVGAALCGLRDFTASKRLARMSSAPAASLVEKLPARQTVLVTGATGFIGSRLVAGLSGAGHQVIALVRDPAKADMLPPPITLITSLDQLPADTRIDAIVNLAGEPIGNGLWTDAKRRKILDSRINMTGDIVKGGKQDRVMGYDLLLSVKSGPMPILSFCVEHGRWQQRGGEDATMFSSSMNTTVGNSLLHYLHALLFGRKIARTKLADDPDALRVAAGLSRAVRGALSRGHGFSRRLRGVAATGTKGFHGTFPPGSPQRTPI